MRPHRNNPKDAFDICVAQRCPFLFNGQLFKCSTAGLTPWILERFGNPNMELWQRYVDTGISHDCSDAELKRFLNNFGKPHAICKQCPSAKDKSSLIDHRSHVEKK